MAMNLEIIFLTRGGGGGVKVYIVLRVYKYLQGERAGGSKSPKSCLRRKWMTPYNVISKHMFQAQFDMICSNKIFPFKVGR